MKPFAEWRGDGPTTGAANTAVTVTQAAINQMTHYVSSFEVVVIGAAPGSDMLIEIKSGTTVLWRTYIGNAAARGTSVGGNFIPPLKGTAENTAVTLEVAAGGGSTQAVASLAGFSW